MAYYPKTRYRPTIRQREFVHWYLHKDGDAYGNAYRAALKAGYSESYARKITTYTPWEQLSVKFAIIAFAAGLARKYPDVAKQTMRSARDAEAIDLLALNSFPSMV